MRTLAPKSGQFDISPRPTAVRLLADMFDRDMLEDSDLSQARPLGVCHIAALAVNTLDYQ
jgi:hypothetical protein